MNIKVIVCNRGGNMTLLYWPLIAACLYMGYNAFPAWAIVVLGAAATIVFALVNPQAFRVGVRERGTVYLAIMTAGSSLVTGIFFGAGWLLGRVFGAGI